jgi:hypothetical protein
MCAGEAWMILAVYMYKHPHAPISSFAAKAAATTTSLKPTPPLLHLPP